MPYTTAGKNKMLAALGVTHVAAYSGDPSAAGVELARVAISFAAPANGSREQSAAPQFSISAGATVDYMAYFDAASAGTLLMLDSVTPETFGANGTYTLNSSAHDLNK